MELNHHIADADIAYHWFTYVPETLPKSELSSVWVSGLHGNIVTDAYDDIIDETRDLLDRFAMRSLANRLRAPLLAPVLPRPFTPDRQSSIYTVTFPRVVFLHTTSPFFKRPDLTLNRMIRRFIHDLRGMGYSVRDTIFMDGFSAGGMFVQRYALLHPAHLQALAAGQCGGALTLPERLYGTTPLAWPSGVYDFDTLVGLPFERTAYQQIPQFIYIGDQDNANSTLGNPGEVLTEPGEVWSSVEQINFLNRTFGATDPVRLQNQVQYLTQLGYHNITFHSRAGVGHTERPFTDDLLAFFDAHR